MSIIFELADIIKDCEVKAYSLLEKVSKTPISNEIVQRSLNDKNVDNLLYHGDNIDAILDLIVRGFKGKIDLIYIDPPFFTMANYNNRVELNYLGEKKIIEYKAYTDTYKGGFREYIEMVTIRLFLMKELLSDKGSIYVHIDFRTVHYIKIIMDYIFGLDNFLNEVIWSYKSGGTSKKHYSRKHDNILVYSKTKNYIFNPQKEKSYNRGFKPYKFKGVMEYQDDIGWYTLVNLKDVWQIDMVGRTSRERLGYDTQKPESLLERIILTSTNEDSIVADFFSGSGTTIAVAEKNNRRWIGADCGNSSILTIMKRMGKIKSKPFEKISLMNKPSIGTIRIRSVSYEILSNNEYKIKVKLDDFHINLEQLNINKKDIELISNILENDSISLIDYINVSFGNNTAIIVYEDFKDKDASNIQTDFDFIIDSLEEKICINIIDVFGNATQEDIKIL
ncbi:site-specific DNA-methyltransferase [Tissierella sp. Yu-01]|uniref:DNA methyltransferase n=1 Tax=Tissierella sp. Yu-01 TaxID=3035694 RepID=UPI00240D4778|nr:site-specific DNA-methyltransferase [Tissierella sp. Yu-01]WFA09390.1 site-specific DNA-methyltransferase [Tissierella sp. Yu-01]